MITLNQEIKDVLTYYNLYCMILLMSSIKKELIFYIIVFLNKFDASVAKAAKIITKYYSKFCPCCKKSQPNIEHLCVKCPTFLNVRLPVSDKLKF